MSPYELISDHRKTYPLGDIRNALLQFTGDTAELLKAHEIPTAFYVNPFAGESLANTPPSLINKLVLEGNWKDLEMLKNAAVLEIPKVKKS